MERFLDRADAGRRLAPLVQHLAARRPVVLALPRGGVPVAYEVAASLGVRLDVLPVRKLGVPGREELAFGAIAPGGRVLNDEVIQAARLTDATIEEVTRRERGELRRRARAYGGASEPVDVGDRTVILIDDGIATGATIRAAVQVLATRRPRALVVATPVAAPATCAELKGLVDDVICAMAPEELKAIGSWYVDFSQTSDAEVRELLDRAAHATSTYSMVRITRRRP